ncbi:hypothetical protein ACFY1J_33650 [Streptomyces sp. NPDC001406]|uniref:hypothetical protein n=1 Tax=Streptomyces sp. NPDC001406 TaxID=3364572 RepID=UPI0036C0B840
MRHRSTPLSRALGGAALLGAAVAVGVVFVRYDADAPRLDVLVALGVTAVLAGAWVLVVRAAPAVERLPAAAARDAIPARLGAVRRDWGWIGAAYLTALAPYAFARGAYGKGGSVLASALCLLTLLFALVLSLFAIGLLKGQLEKPQRLLQEDAARGRVHAVRVRSGGLVRQDYRQPSQTSVGEVLTINSYWIELMAEDGNGGRPIKLRTMDGSSFRIRIGDKHVRDAAARLDGHAGWLCWPTRWKEIVATDKQRELPVAFVVDTGHVVWGVTREEDWQPFLRGGGALVRETEAGLTAVPMERPSRYAPGAHDLSLLFAVGAALVAVPFLLGLVSGALAGLLGAVSGGLALYAAVRLVLPENVNRFMDPELWTVRQESHASLR